ncbi:hypothetical protein [Prochlorococcus marinus]|uniref:hypothetical protein n=1 Tax=Prochlorococcus marinus TaxID=1219 RepID=UPI0022B3A466|nr:hypothetical protein [Prochlorococcus marinus]
MHGAGGGGSGYGIGALDFMDIDGAGNFTCDSVKGSGGSTSDFCTTGEYSYLRDFDSVLE